VLRKTRHFNKEAAEQQYGWKQQQLNADLVHIYLLHI